MKLYRTAMTMAALLASSAAIAQVTNISQTQRRLQVSFAGVVTNDVTNTIMIRQPDGSFAKFTGPVPDYPYKVGDQIALSFSTVVPNSAFYEQPQFIGQKAADGIYKFTVTNVGGSPLVALAENPDISGPAGVSGATTFRGLTVVYDANSDGYSLELPTGEWGVSPINAPSYSYNSTTGALSSGVSSTSLTGTATSGQIGNITTGKIGIEDPQVQAGVGFFDSLKFSGGWNFPIFNGGGTPTPVPEPGTMLIFGGGAAWLMRRRRKRAA